MPQQRCSLAEELYYALRLLDPKSRAQTLKRSDLMCFVMLSITSAGDVIREEDAQPSSVMYPEIINRT